METKSKPTLKTLCPLLTGRKKDIVDRFIIRASQFYSLKELYEKINKTPDEKTKELLEQVEKDLISTMNDKNFKNIQLEIEQRANLFKELYSKLDYNNILKLSDTVKKYPTTYQKHLSSSKRNFIDGSSTLFSLAKFFRYFANEKIEAKITIKDSFINNLIESKTIVLLLNLIDDTFDYQGFFEYNPYENKNNNKEKTKNKKNDDENEDEQNQKVIGFHHNELKLNIPLLTGNKKDSIDFLFINARKYIKFAQWMNEVSSDKIPLKMRMFRATVQNESVKALNNKNYDSTMNEIKNRVNLYKEKLNDYSEQDILNIVDIIITQNPNDFEQHLENEQLEFVEGCDMLNSMELFFKVLNKATGLDASVKEEDIEMLTNSKQIQLFTSNVKNNFNTKILVNDFMMKLKNKNNKKIVKPQKELKLI